MNGSESYCPKTYKTANIIATILFFPVGLFGLHYGKQTYRYYKHPDEYNIAVKYSQKAASSAGIGILLGLALWITVILMVM